MDAIDHIKSALKKPGKSQTGLAEALGRYPSAISSLLKGTRKLKADEIAPVAAYLEIEASLLSGVNQSTEPTLEATQSAAKVRLPTQETPNTIPGASLIGDRDLPVFATAQGGRGAMVLSSDPVDWVARPDPLSRVKDGYGVLITEDSMAPEFRSGDIALVNPHLAPRPGDTCVFRSHRDDETVMAIIKYLRKSTSELWQVSEWDSGDGQRRDFSLKKSEWQVCHVTVGNYKRR